MKLCIELDLIRIIALFVFHAGNYQTVNQLQLQALISQ
jgi:hypothetical protein